MNVKAKNGSDKSAPPQNWLLWATHSRYTRPEAEKWCAFWGGEDGAVSLDASDITPGRFTMEVRSLPLWRELQVVRLRRSEQAGVEVVNSLAAYLESPNATTALLVEYGGAISKAKPAPTWKAILKSVQSRNCSPRSVRQVVMERVRSEAFAITPAAVSALEEWACRDTGKAGSAMDLLILYKTEEKKIEAEDLDKLLGTGGAPTVWNLQDAFMEGNRKETARLLLAVERSAATQPIAVVGMLARQMRLLMLLHGYRARGEKDGSVPLTAFKFKQTFQLRKLSNLSGKWPEARTRKALSALYDLDLALKGDPGDPWTILEAAMLNLLNP